MTDEEEHVARLVYPDEYAKNVSQVASISTHRLFYVKRKELALKPYELLEFPISECTSITYEVKWAIVPMVFGVFLIAIVLFILSSDLTAAVRIPVGALAVAAVFGGVLAKGPKRHRLTFTINGKRMRWQSKAGDFKCKAVSVGKVITYAKDSGLYRDKQVHK